MQEGRRSPLSGAARRRLGWLALGAALCAVLGAALWFRSLEVEPPPAVSAAVEVERAPVAAALRGEEQSTWALAAVDAAGPAASDGGAAAEAVDLRVPDTWCELIDGAAALPEPGSVVVEVVGGVGAGGTLTALYTLRRDRDLEDLIRAARGGYGDPPRRRALALTRDRATALRCAGLQALFQLELADGRRAEAPWSPDGGVVRLEPRRVVRVRGRVVAGGAPFPGAEVRLGGGRTTAGPDGTFELELTPGPGENLGWLFADGTTPDGWWVPEKAPRVFYAYGGPVDAGDVVLKKRPPGPRGTLGITWSFSGRGPEVEEVTTGSPAAQAGVRPRDLVLEVDGALVQTIADATRLMLEGAAPAARLKVQRGSEFLLLDVLRSWEE